MATSVGTISLLATIDTSQYKKGAQDIEKANQSMENSGDATTDNLNAGFSKVAKIGLAAVASAVVAVGALIVTNIGNAIDRVDILNNSSRTFENLGFTADAVKSAMTDLEKSIRGLPTSLDEAVRGVQLLSGSTNDVGKAQKIFSALNNAIIGFGGSSVDVSGAIVQLSQAFSNGRIDAQTWNSLIQNNLGPTLNALAREMGLTTGALKEGLSDGTISVQTFQDALIKLNKEGGGGMKSLEQISKDATSGIGTGWANLNTAITRGVASVIESVGSANISGAITNIGKAFETALKAVSASIGFLVQYKDTITQIATVITVLLIPAMLRYVAVQTLAGIAALASGARMAAAWLLALGPIGLIVAAVAAATYLIVSNWDTIQQAAVTAFEWVKNNWPLILAILTGPIGQAVYIINRNWDTIKSAVGSLVDWIQGAFRTIGNIAASAIKIPVNAIINFAQSTINGFINAINGAINAINRIPGVNIGKLGTMSIPMLASGGIVSSPTLAMVGEGREPEAVIPLSKLDDIIANSSTSVSPKDVEQPIIKIPNQSAAEYRQGAINTIKAYNEYLRSKSLPEIGVA